MSKEVILKSSKKLALFILLPVIALGCHTSDKGTIVHLQIVDRNGYTKTVTDPDQIKKFEFTDVKGSSQHEKIIKVYDKNQEGAITLYHDSGLLWQYLETKGGRAHGVYEEYDRAGKLHIKSFVTEGIADLTDEAKTSWVFDDISTVYDPKGNIVAKIPYLKGVQEGEAQYFYTNGAVKTKIPYSKNKIVGQVRGYDEQGNLNLMINYLDGVKEGEAYSNGSIEAGAYEEVYRNGRLVFGKYFDTDGKLYSEIENSKGIKPIFENGILVKTEEYNQGKIQGAITTFRNDRTIESCYSVVDGKKDGEEIVYYPAAIGIEPVKKLLISWREGLIHGRVCTWYPNGVLESEKEMIDHKKEGTYLSWYMDSSLMMVEEYRQDTLLNGKYLRKGDNVPISRVIDGVGDAHIYDKNGLLVRKITYYNGNPIE